VTHYLFSLADFYLAVGNGFFKQSKTGLATHCWRWAMVFNPAQLAAIENFRALGRLTLNEFSGSNPLNWLHQAPRQEDWIAKALYGKIFKTSAAYTAEHRRLLRQWEETPRLELGGKSPEKSALNNFH
jgi:hypothetical protein